MGCIREMPNLTFDKKWRLQRQNGTVPFFTWKDTRRSTKYKIAQILFVSNAACADTTSKHVHLPFMQSD